jgi:hypothetical protein
LQNNKNKLSKKIDFKLKNYETDEAEFEAS